MKKVLVLIMAIIMTCDVAKAQFSASNKIYAFIKAGQNVQESNDVCLIFFIDRGVYISSGKIHVVKDAYRKDPSLMIIFKTNDGRWRSGYTSMGVYKYLYDSDKSTSKRTTYSDFHPAGHSSKWGTSWPDYYRCLSFSQDRESLIQWSTDSDNKTYYQRIDLSEFAPKSQNRDFLYE